MSSGSGDKPPGGTAPGRPAADTPQRIVVRSIDPSQDSFGASDTAVAGGQTSLSGVPIGSLATPAAGMVALTDIVGTTLSGRYLVTRKVGQGGMGAVYEATHTEIKKRVAVKVLLEKYTQREAIVARLKQEAQLASSVDNEHIIHINDFGTTDDGRTFVVMEFLDGESLAECLGREPKLPEQRILRIAAQTAEALVAAHAKGVVHRDIKPENVFLLKRKEQDFVKVVDFGISKSLRQSTEEEEQPRLTQTGMVLGTPLYMSPEQARGDENLDHRVDIYALGVIMYEAASGRVPFAGNNYLSVISQVLNEEPTPLRELRPELSEEFEAIVMRAMAKDRDDRYATSQDMLHDITAVLDDPTRSTERAKITGPRRLLQRPTIPRMAWAIGGLGLAVGAVMLAVVLLMGSTEKPRKIADLPVVMRIDAGLPAVVDAVAEPVVAKITLHIVSIPPGATIFRESEPLGTAPRDIELVKRNKEVRVSASLDGYDDAAVSINPDERNDGQTVTLQLKKLAKGQVKKPRPKLPGGGSATPTTNHTAGGEWTGDPFTGSGSLPKK